ncbi:MAG: class I SAM-dependent RNA methyltransferase [Candidatus Puniceispirillaceae bacterium]
MSQGHKYSSRRHKGARRRDATSHDKDKLPKNAPQIEVTITHIGGRGDGVGIASYTHNYETKDYPVFVPDTLPGEIVIAQPLRLNKQGIQAELRELIQSAPLRKAPDCDASPACGGCQFQHMDPSAYQEWKQGQLRSVLQKGGIEPSKWRPDYQSAPHSRRRARLAFRRRRDDVLIGFRERQSHQIIYPSNCQVISKDISRLISFLQTNMLLCLDNGMTGEVEITLCDNGCDVVFHSSESWPQSVVTDMIMMAADADIMRLSLSENNQAPHLLFVKQEPAIAWDYGKAKASLYPAPASFLQADKAAETIMQKDILSVLSQCNTIVDLFAGSGTLSAPLLLQTRTGVKITAIDSAKEALSAYESLAHRHGLSMQLATQSRNLHHAPFTIKELEGFDAAIIDPPRAGANAQVTLLAQSDIPHIVMVSCNPHSFIKDAAILCAAGYDCQWVRHIDQFAFTSHSEVIAYFQKPAETMAKA